MNKVLIIGDEIDNLFNKYFKKSEMFKSESITLFLDINANIPFDFQRLPRDRVDALIDYYWPTLCRWIENYSSLYDFKSLMRIYIGRAVARLTKNSIRAVIFPSGIPHHLDTVILSISCEIVQIKQFYIYAEGLTGGYFLICQPAGIQSRSIVEMNSGKCFDESLFKPLMDYQPPKWSSQVRNIRGNFLISLVFSLCKRLLISVRNLITERNDTSVNLEQKFGIQGNRVLPLLKSMLSQLKYIRKYNSLSKKEPYKKFVTEGKLTFVIYGSYQPEATTAPEGGSNYNFIDIIAEIRNSFPNSTIIFKDHPGARQYFLPIVLETRVGYCRSTVFLDVLKTLDCKFVPFDGDTDIQYLDAIFVAVNGTIALQRGLNGKKTVIFGYPSYKNLPSVLSWTEFKMLSETSISEFKKKSIKVEDDVKIFLTQNFLNNTINLDINLGRDGSRSFTSDHAPKWLSQAASVIRTALD